MMKKGTALILILFMLCSCAMAAEVRLLKPGEAQPFGEDEELIKLYMFNIKAQDSFLLVAGGECMLIDCGTFGMGSVVAQELKNIGIEHIDYALNTHPHDDHIGGYNALLPEFSVGEFLTCFPPAVNQQQKQALALCDELGIPVRQFTADDDLDFGGISFLLYQDDQSTNMNYKSMVMHLTYGDCAALLVADIGRTVHARLTNTYGDRIKADILKLPHHGISVPGKKMVTTVDPEYCVLTNYKNDQSNETIKLLTGWKYKILYTTRGTLEFTTNGEYWTCVQHEKWW